MFCGNTIKYPDSISTAVCDSQCAFDPTLFCGDTTGQNYNVFSYNQITTSQPASIQQTTTALENTQPATTQPASNEIFKKIFF